MAQPRPCFFEGCTRPAIRPNLRWLASCDAHRPFVKDETRMRRLLEKVNAARTALLATAGAAPEGAPEAAPPQPQPQQPICDYLNSVGHRCDRAAHWPHIPNRGDKPPAGFDSKTCDPAVLVRCVTHKYSPGFRKCVTPECLRFAQQRTTNGECSRCGQLRLSAANMAARRERAREVKKAKAEGREPAPAPPARPRGAPRRTPAPAPPAAQPEPGPQPRDDNIRMPLDDFLAEIIAGVA